MLVGFQEILKMAEKYPNGFSKEDIKYAELDNDKIVEYAKNIVNNDLSVRDVENLSIQFNYRFNY